MSKAYPQKMCSSKNTATNALPTAMAPSVSTRPPALGSAARAAAPRHSPAERRPRRRRRCAAAAPPAASDAGSPSAAKMIKQLTRWSLESADFWFFVFRMCGVFGWNFYTGAMIAESYILSEW